MTSQSLQSLNLNLVAVTVAMGLSWKRRGGLYSFFAFKFIYMGRPYLAKVNSIGSVCGILLSFSRFPWQRIYIF